LKATSAGQESPPVASELATKSETKLGHYVDLVLALTIKEIKVRYKGTFLGYGWSLLNPLVFAVTYWIAFKAILNVKIEGYFIFLLAGLFPWQWLNNSLQLAPRAFTNNASLIKKIAFPRYLIVASSVVTEGFHFLLCLPVLVALALLFGRGTVSWTWLWGAPLLLIVQGLMIYGIALAVASCSVFFRDLERLIGLGMSVLFYVTPVIYERHMVPAMFQPLLAFNPFTYLIVSWRALLLDGTMNWLALGTAALIAVVAVAIGQAVFDRMQWKFAEAL
jgi:lipopolysaccharide transport system permease protein